jgi:anhydro-N-acetylmuramic acid kinase
MNKSLQKLIDISKQPSRKIIGLMSGTSLDGLDIVLCEVFGNGLNTKIKVEHFTTVVYNNDFVSDIKSVFSTTTVSLQQVCLMNIKIAEAHAHMIINCMKDWQVPLESIDLIASHGQTIFHAPSSFHRLEGFGNATLQIGDGDHLAVKTGIITVSDFRQRQTAAGGEGAPLAAYGDYLLFGKHTSDTVLLNIGGIANLTYIPANKGFESVVCSDIGPGNTLLNSWVAENFEEMSFDKDAKIASKGKINYSLLNMLLSDDFFNRPFPKSTGPELFNLQFVKTALQLSNSTSISNEDVLATLTAFTANGIIMALEKIMNDNCHTNIYVSGGGIHNPMLMAFLLNHFADKKTTIQTTFDFNPDAKEAILFAILANELIVGDGECFGKGGLNLPNVSMGKICFPA